MASKVSMDADMLKRFLAIAARKKRRKDDDLIDSWRKDASVNKTKKGD